MIKYTALLFLGVGCLAQWRGSEWEHSSWKNQEVKQFPQLPGSFPVYAIEASTSTTTTPGTATTKPTAPAPTTCSTMFGCADCGTVQVCRPSQTGFVPVSKLPCPTTAPYCSKKSGTCSQIPDSDCGGADTFLCPDNGYFPDATNCSLYHACNNYMPQAFSCAEGQTYEPDRAACSSNVTCDFTVQCGAETQIKLNMGDTHFYTYCSTGKPLTVSRCPGEYKLNSTSQVCEPLCQQDGLMADLLDCTKYYKCSKLYITDSLSVPIRENLPCPDNEAFDPAAYQCMPKNSTTCNK